MAYDKDDPEVQQAIRDAVKEANAGLEKNRDTILTEKRALEAQLKELDGIDPTKYQELEAAADKREAERAKRQGDYDALLKRSEAEHKKVTEALEAQNKTLKRDRDMDYSGREIVAALAEHGGNPLLLEHHIQGQVQVRDVDGRRQVVVVDDRGEALLSKTAETTGQMMSVRELVAAMKQEDRFAQAFAGTGSGGSGSRIATTTQDGVTSIPAGDSEAFGQNLEGIASGKVKVQGT